MITVIVCALVAHICYATNDLSGALASRKFDGKAMTLLSFLFAMVLYLVLMPFLFHAPLTFLPVAAASASGVGFAVAYPIFIKAAKGGNATIVGVIAGTFPLWVVAFSALLFHERLTMPQAAAVGVIIIGIILSALHLDRKTRFKNLFNQHSLLAFCVSILWGITFALMKYPVDKMGWFETGFINCVAGLIVCAVLFYPGLKGKLKIVIRKYYFYPVVNAFTGIAGTLTYTFALTRGNSSIVAPIAGSYSGLFAIMSYIKFKEKLTRLQLLGVVLILIGVIALSFIVSRS